MVKCNFVRDFL